MSAIVPTMRSNDMRSSSEYEDVDRWIRFGLTDGKISRLTKIPRETVRDWRNAHGAGQGWCQSPFGQDADCPMCSRAVLPPVPYAYLLGLYLGDGCLSPYPRGVYRLRITLDQRYPRILAECAQAITSVRPSRAMRVGRAQKVGCIELYACWKHWPCLFPQHGAGRKHERKIELANWQREVASAEPAALLRGLIHSDGYRGLNWVKGKGYPRYQFTSESADIRAIFCQACSDYGVAWRRMNRKTISVARASDVARLDAVIGPKS
jgi:hypothetical protein